MGVSTKLTHEFQRFISDDHSNLPWTDRINSDSVRTVCFGILFMLGLYSISEATSIVTHKFSKRDDRWLN